MEPKATWTLGSVQIVQYFGSVTTESVALLESERSSQYMEQFGPPKFVLDVDMSSRAVSSCMSSRRRDRF